MPSEATFSTITCGIDGSAAALEAARQATALAGGDASVELVAIVGRHGRARPLPLAGSRTVTNVLRRVEVPVLCAVAPPHGRAFPGR